LGCNRSSHASTDQKILVSFSSCFSSGILRQTFSHETYPLACCYNRKLKLSLGMAKVTVMSILIMMGPLVRQTS
jgi:hypothetical protein